MNRREFLQASASGVAIAILPIAGCEVDSVTPDGQQRPSDSVDGRFVAIGPPALLVHRSTTRTFFLADGSRFEVTPLEHKLVERNADGSIRLELASAGTGPYDLNHPAAAAVGADGNLYIVDQGNDRIQVFDRSGLHVRQIGRAGTGWGELARPSAMAFFDDTRLMVCDTFNHRVAVFDVTGNALETFGQLGEGPADLNAPRGIVVADDGTVHVLDAGNGRVQVFRDGSVIRSYGERAALRGASSLAIGSDGLVYVAATLCGSVRSYDAGNGSLIRELPVESLGSSLAPLHLSFLPGHKLLVEGLPSAS